MGDEGIRDAAGNGFEIRLDSRWDHGPRSSQSMRKVDRLKPEREQNRPGPAVAARGESEPTPWPPMPRIPVAWGEVFDKLSILDIKLGRLAGQDKLDNVRREREAILEVVGDMNRYPSTLWRLVEELQSINEHLWLIEDAKRACERRQQFDADFIQLAREVYLRNDERASIKQQINRLLGSSLVEEKSHDLQT